MKPLFTMLHAANGIQLRLRHAEEPGDRHGPRRHHDMVVGATEVQRVSARR